MPSASGASISIGTAGVQDTNILIATKGAIVTGTNKIQIGASANALSVASGTITLGTADAALSIGANTLQSSNIVIGTKGAVITGTNKIVIGATANTLSLSSGTINLNSPLTPTYTISPPLGQIGYRYFNSDTTVAITSTRFCQCRLNSGANLPAGTYFLSYLVTFSATTTSFTTGFGIPAGPITDGVTPTGILYQFGGTVQNLANNGGSFAVNGSSMIYFDGTKGASVGISCVPNQTITNVFLQAFRIA
jgi:hypothetical protein